MKLLKKILIVIGIIIGLGFGGLCIYASDYRTLEEEYTYILEEEGVYSIDDIIYFEADSDVVLIFYPGGRVEYIAYAPLCKKL